MQQLDRTRKANRVLTVALVMGVVTPSASFHTNHANKRSWGTQHDASTGNHIDEDVLRISVLSAHMVLKQCGRGIH